MTKHLLRRKKFFSFVNTKLLSLCLLVFSQSSLAIESAKLNEEIQVSADYMQLNVETGNSIFSGNVKISQGDLVLMGEKVTLKRKRLKNGDNEIEHFTITGQPARYNHVTDNGEVIQAESERMVYTANVGKLVMTTNAKLTQPDNQVSSQKIVYDTLKKIVLAGSKNPPSETKGKTSTENSADRKNEQQRVKITLTPKKSGKSSDKNK